MIGKALLVVTGIVGAMMLVPGDRTAPTAATHRESTLQTSPELARFLDNAVAHKAAAKTPEQVIAEMAAEPEPGVAEPVTVSPRVSAAPVTQIASVDVSTAGQAISARSAVNIRSGPSTEYATLSVLQPDMPVTVVGRQDGWVKVQQADGTTGWVYGSYLGDDPGATAAAAPQRERPIREARAEAPASGGMEVQAGGSIRLRAGPSSLSQSLMQVEPGTPMMIAEQRRGWLRVVLPDGVSGWIKGRV